MKKAQYRFTHAPRAELTWQGSSVRIVLRGRNTSDTEQTVSFTVEWWWLRQLVSDIKNLWKTERQSRIDEINRIDEVL